MSALIIANAVGDNVADIRDAEYQPHHWSPRVWSVSGYYYTVTRSARPPKVTSYTGEDFTALTPHRWELMPPEQMFIAPKNAYVWRLPNE